MTIAPQESPKMPEIVPVTADIAVLNEEHLQSASIEFLLGFVSLVGVLYLGVKGQWLFMALALPFLAIRGILVVSKIRWEMLRLCPMGDELWLVRHGRKVRGIPYRDIASYRFGGDGDSFWLRILMVSNEVGLEIPRSRRVLRASASKLSLIQQIGPKLSKEAVPPRLFLPDDKAEALLVKYHHMPPTVSMKPGVSYRYVSPEGLQKLIVTDRLKEILVACFVACLLVPIFTWEWFALIPAYAFVCSLDSLMRHFGPAGKFRKSVHDRFIFLPDGTLLVTRKKRSWRLSNPELSIGRKGSFLLSGAPIVRYGTGLSAYYFDPRFIEEDV